MNCFCPFIKADCKSECVFWIPETDADAFSKTHCRLAVASGQLVYIGETLAAKLTEDDDTLS